MKGFSRNRKRKTKKKKTQQAKKWKQTKKGKRDDEKWNWSMESRISFRS